MDGRQHRWFVVTASVAPILGTVGALVLVWNRVFAVTDLVILAVMYVVCGLGISTGYHRLLTHRSFETYRPIRLALAAAGAIAGQGPPIIWAAHHRKHHRVADRPGDPHSPQLERGPGVRGVGKGLWHAHLGWLFDPSLESEPMRYCPDLSRDPALRWMSERFVIVVGLGLIPPALLGWALTGGLSGALRGLLWGGLVRTLLINHMTYAVNSIGHVCGRRRFATPDQSRNVSWLALPSFGEAWHNNHHAFPRSARHGLRWWEVDLSAGFIWLLERLGLAWKVVRIEPHRILGKETAGGPAFATEPPVPLAERLAGQPLSVMDVE
jgi:stearoyl-CoA desaturase (delta-9 desaturase)